MAEEGRLVGTRGQYRVEKAPTELHISPTVQGVLAARIDRLSREEKELLQHLAVIGREFPLSLIRQVISRPEEELYRLLSALQNKEFLYEQPAFPEVEYLFKHALTQEVAYNSVLHERRKALHEHTAKAIETLYSTNLDEHYSELAHHYSRSGNTPKAIDYLQRAGQRSAHADAIRYLTVALELLLSLPDTPERAQQELRMQLTLGTLFQATKGFAAAEAEAAYTRARELCQRVEEPLQLFSVLFGLANVYNGRGAYQTGLELAEHLLSLAQKLQDSVLLIGTHLMLEYVLYLLGEPVSAKVHSEQVVSLYRPQHSSTLLSLYGFDAGVVGLSDLGNILWLLGYPDQALSKSHEALKAARELSHPFSLAWVLSVLSVQHQLRREGSLAQGYAESLLSLSEEHGFPLYSAWGTGHCGWALAEQGRIDEGIAQLLQSRTAFQVMEIGFNQSYRLAWLAEAYGKGGQADTGLEVIAEALNVVQNTGEHHYEAELYRLKGELSLQSRQGKARQVKSEDANPRSLTPNPQTEAEACFHKAIEIARRQSAKSLELRAVMSLSRLWQQRGKKDEARQLLAEIYGWFTEGFGTTDLQEAKALLGELLGE